MKRLIFILYLISFLLISWSAFSQAITQTGFVGKFSFQSFSAGGSSDVTGTLDAFSDQTNQYFANNIQVADVIWDNQGNRWEVMAVNSSNLLQADVDLRSVNGAGGTPFGVGFVSRETPNMGLSLFVPDNNIGISQQLKSRIESHNMLLIDQYMASNQDSVFTGATAADTSTVTDPIIGDVLVADNGDVGYYDGTSWVINSGGAGTWLKPELENNGTVTIESNESVIFDDGSSQAKINPEGFQVESNSDYVTIGVDGIELAQSSEELTININEINAEDIEFARLNKFYIDADQDTTGTKGYFLGHDTDGEIRLLPVSGGSPDGNGIYSGSGTVPDSTLANITDRFMFLGESLTSIQIDNPIEIPSDFTVGKQDFSLGMMNIVTGSIIPDSVTSWGWKSEIESPQGSGLSEFLINPMGGIYGRYEIENIGTGIHQDNGVGSFKFLKNDSGDSTYYHLGPSGMEQSYYDNGDSTKFEFNFNQVDLDFQDGNNRFLLTRDANISLTANTGFTATTTSGILGLTHTGSSGQLIVQSQDERATFQGEDTRINGDTVITMNAAGGGAEMIIKDNSIQLADLPDDNAPIKILGLNSNREIVETDTLIQASNGVTDGDPSASMDFELGGSLEKNTTILGEDKRLDLDSLNRFYVQNTQGNILLETDTMGDRQSRMFINVGITYMETFNYATDQKARMEINQSGEVILTASNLDSSIQTRIIMEKEYIQFQGVPEYANDAGADGDGGLPAGALYTVAGDRSIRIKP